MTQIRAARPIPKTLGPFILILWFFLSAVCRAAGPEVPPALLAKDVLPSELRFMLLSVPSYAKNFPELWPASKVKRFNQLMVDLGQRSGKGEHRDIFFFIVKNSLVEVLFKENQLPEDPYLKIFTGENVLEAKRYIKDNASKLQIFSSWLLESMTQEIETSLKSPVRPILQLPAEEQKALLAKDAVNEMREYEAKVKCLAAWYGLMTRSTAREFEQEVAALTIPVLERINAGLKLLGPLTKRAANEKK